MDDFCLMDQSTHGGGGGIVSSHYSKYIWEENPKTYP